jgi:hypothetical protein
METMAMEIRVRMGVFIDVVEVGSRCEFPLVVDASIVPFLMVLSAEKT